ncbi:MAG: hypothetical protein QNJ64_16340 [Crocosphaera sp.]|nr:hypothetical protein [Crocosphaera sp.]
MVCIDKITICDIPEFSSSVQKLGLKVLLADSLSSNSFSSGDCLTNVCLDSTGTSLLSALTPLITKLAFMLMLWLILHLFYSLIPGEI